MREELFEAVEEAWAERVRPGRRKGRRLRSFWEIVVLIQTLLLCYIDQPRARARSRVHERALVGGKPIRFSPSIQPASQLEGGERHERGEGLQKKKQKKCS